MSGWRCFALSCLLVAMAGCGGGAEVDGDGPSAEAADAKRIAKTTIVVDTHIDLPYRLLEKMEDVSVRTESGDFDHPRAVEGGLDAAFMSIYVPARFQQDGGARRKADELIDLVERIASDHPDKFRIAVSVADIERNFGDGVVSLPMGIENGAAIENDLRNLEHFHRRGVRYVTLTHSKNNRICDSSYDEERKWNGLSPFGAEVVAEMNRLGMMIDVSHVSDDAFYQVIERTTAPVIASHSSCRHFTPGFERNMSDDMLRALKANGGVIQINFGSYFLRADYIEKTKKRGEAIEKFLAQHGLEREHADTRRFIERYDRDNPRGYAELADVADHIDHVVGLIGVDHVGLGSDFDGVGDSLPTGLKDVSDYPNLFAELLRRGYSEEQIARIASGNLLRVWRRVEEVAAGPGGAGD